jgi:hypothetical protein
MLKRRSLLTGLLGNDRLYAQKLLDLFGKSIISLLPLDDLSGTMAADLSGNGRNGVYGGSPALGQPSLHKDRRSVTLSGTNAWVNWYSTGLKNAFNGAEGSLLLWCTVPTAAWTDGSGRYLVRLAADANNFLFLTKESNSNTFDWVFKAGSGTAVTMKNWYMNQNPSPYCVALTWSASHNRVRGYANGVQQSIEYPVGGTWAGTLPSNGANIGAYINASSGVWSGGMQWALLLNREATPAEMATVADVSLGEPLPPTDDGFTVAFLPDTQTEALNYKGMIAQQIQWIINNQAKYNIQAVIGVGDIVEHYNVPAEWADGVSAYNLLDATSIPYFPCAGNHDYDAANVFTTYNSHFPQSHFTALPWWNGVFQNSDSQNNYFYVTIGNVRYYFVNIQVSPTASNLAWLDGVLTTLAAYHVILTVHDMYVTPYNGLLSPAGENVWNVVKTHDNVIWIQAGHSSNPAIAHASNDTVRYTNGGSICNIAVVDYQDWWWGGWGEIRLVTFYPTAKKVVSQTYSPITRKCEGGDNYFTVNYSG